MDIFILTPEHHHETGRNYSSCFLWHNSRPILRASPLSIASVAICFLVLCGCANLGFFGGAIALCPPPAPATPMDLKQIRAQQRI